MTISTDIRYPVCEKHSKKSVAYTGLSINLFAKLNPRTIFILKRSRAYVIGLMDMGPVLTSEGMGISFEPVSFLPCKVRHRLVGVPGVG